MYPEYFLEKPTERLLGKGILPSHINEDVMERFLDSLYEHGVSWLYQEIALRVVKYLKLPCKSLNIDTTSFHLDGQYERDSVLLSILESIDPITLLPDRIDINVLEQFIKEQLDFAKKMMHEFRFSSA